MSKTKKPPVDRAAARIRKPKRTDAERVSVTRSISQAMPQSPDWANATDLQAAVKVWSADADAIDTNGKLLVNLRGQVKTAEAKQLALRQNWVVSTAHVLSTATVLCGGSAERIQALSLDVDTRNKVGTLGVLAGLVVNPGTVTGEIVSAWTRGNAFHGFVVQHATDPANPATVSPPIPWTKHRFTLGGLAAKATMSFRVAAIDPTSPTGIGPWTDWVVGNAK
jgi:hypothetical protein